MDLEERKVAADISVANRFVNRTYLSELTELEVVPLEEHLKRFQSIRLYKIDKLVFDKNKDVNDRLVSVFNSVQNTRSNLVMVVRGKKQDTELYLGVQSTREIGVADSVFKKSLLGNFPGSSAKRISPNEVSELLTEATAFEEDCENHLTTLNVIPALRQEKEDENFVQGLENFIDTMKGEEYTCIIIGSSVADSECEQRLRGYEEMYSALFPLSNMSISHGTSTGQTVTEGFTKSISETISSSISKTTGTSVTDTSTSGFNFGVGLFSNSFGKNNSTSHAIGKNESTANTDTRSSTDTKSINTSVSKTDSVTDNVTVNYKDKTIEDLLENIEKRIERIKECTTFGMWECAAYFISSDIQTSVVAANAFRSLMIGEENKNEKSFLNLFSMGNRLSTSRALESLQYCRHPVFRTNAVNERQLVTATEYISGKELPLMFTLPRKSVSGVTVTSMAEFGRNVVRTNNFGKTEYVKTMEIGKISHMNKVEDTPVILDLQSLTSHCFVTGSTGSGKSNTTFTLINELIKDGNDIPFLVVEPAKGEYKFAFTNVPGINIFTTTHAFGRFLKINPFRFQPNIHVLEHLDRLIEIFNTCWEMYAAMPAILKDAIEKIYEKKGWDLLNSVYLLDGEPQYPTFKDLLIELPEIINQSGYSSDTKGDYIGALVTRVNSLTNGIVGQIFCDCYDVEDEVMFDQSTIVDLSRVGSSETKSLIMGLLVLKLNEYRMAKGQANNAPLRHVTILEEAHNLLKNVKNSAGGGSSVVAKSVEMICNSIAEMRTYGEGFIIVDQSPGAVDIAAIKNTNTKIIMRLPEMSDCEVVGRSVSLNEEQILEISKLRTGSAIVMQNNWSDAVLSQINRYTYDYTGEIQACTGHDILKFKSAVITALLNEYLVRKTKSVANVLEEIESFDIDQYKKADAKRMVETVCAHLDKKWSSLYLGRAIMQYTGLDTAFRRAERTVKDMPKKPDKRDKNTEKSADNFDLQSLVSFLNGEVERLMISDAVVKDKIVQYALYAKMYDDSPVDYERIYRARYVR